MTCRVDAGAADLAWALKAVLPHAGRDDTLPTLNAVHFEVTGGYLYAVATDRYTLGAARIRATYAASGVVHGAVTYRDAKEIRAWAKAARAGTSGNDSVTLHFGPRGSVLPATGAAPWPVVPGEFPDWRKILGHVLHAEPIMPPVRSGFRSAMLGRFAAAEEGRGLTFRLVASAGHTVRGEPSAMMGVFGERFAGAAMGATLDNAEDPYPVRALASWREAVPAPAEALVPVAATA